MPKGFGIPIKESVTGGFMVVDGDENDRKIIKISLSDDENDNAFQQEIALGERMIFDSDDPDTRTWIVQRVKRIFQRFQAQTRFKLLENTLVWDENSEDGKTVLKFRYLNLESDEEREYEQQFGEGV